MAAWAVVGISSRDEMDSIIDVVDCASSRVGVSIDVDKGSGCSADGGVDVTMMDGVDDEELSGCAEMTACVVDSEGASNSGVVDVAGITEIEVS